MSDPTETLELRVLQTPEEMQAAEALQEVVWQGASPVPDHLLIAAMHNGGITVGAFHQAELIGAVFGFTGLYRAGENLKVKHCSHFLAVHPDFRDAGVGFKLKRAQWQLARQQGLDLITWTYDPLESRNANLNIAKLGAICRTYRRNEYGEMADELNKGIPSDRFEVDWWVYAPRVKRRMESKTPHQLDLAHYLSAGVQAINTTKLNKAGWPVPEQDQMDLLDDPEKRPVLTLLEFPSDYQGLKSADRRLAHEWRMYSRVLFELLFSHGYIVTDMVYLAGTTPRSYYVLSHGESTLG